MMEPKMQRKLLMFVTGSDRIPVTGSSHLYLQITCGGEDVGRLPSAHTCFNQLILYQHKSQDHLQKVLEMAILESQGFYVK
jgi:E3 ubiquitin-protein ligase HECTD2